MFALLLGHLGQTGKRRVVLAFGQRRIAQRVDAVQPAHGQVRFDLDGPPRAVSTPSHCPAGDALTPAPQTIVPAGMKRPPIVAPSGVMSSTGCPVITVTPNCSSRFRAYRDSGLGNVARIFGPASTSS